MTHQASRKHVHAGRFDAHRHEPLSLPIVGELFLRDQKRHDSFEHLTSNQLPEPDGNLSFIDGVGIQQVLKAWAGEPASFTKLRCEAVLDSQSALFRWQAITQRRSQISPPSRHSAGEYIAVWHDDLL
ncbi:hypothetical protein [Nocardioides terrisoli]|uniref:hypothetical protein n=1 Tax=Nocardioides terrisoli TaxID=3388267 RepID=UPI00287B9361|nr:hypothetical protein [Nocardioides marmorisolisilvae]